ncbi:hypothetical protein POF45_26935 [Pseudomonas sp. 681]|uniref:Uncharacterized protein n=1 Tax=Pseudomonas fungipugnans TaxID=3024217 RepID=A0ABT6QVU1_9PSED|nr:hypothetical protein [Pseudomonas sp. 681]MDI2595030.1 hypothetical protein [Pseudomonas sp. 681]
MKKLLAIMLIASAPSAFAETVLVDPGPNHMFVGEQFDARVATEVLYEDRPCKLPITEAKNMREYTTTGVAVPMKGCWGRTLGGGVIRILENGMTMRATEAAYVVAQVDKTGAAVVMKSVYDRKNYEPCKRAYQRGQWCLKGQD